MNIKPKHILLPFVALTALYLSACQKDFTVDEIPPSIVDSTMVNDTSKILTKSSIIIRMEL
jgi:hypothetical protein